MSVLSAKVPVSDSIVKPYTKDEHLEAVIGRMNESLYELEVELVQEFDTPQFPVVFIGGIQRSGTTLVIQLMRACFEIGYISNLTARFWKAPYIGALLMRELTQKEQARKVSFESELGATYGYDGSHEFGFFWQRWFPYNVSHQPLARDVDEIDYSLLRKELSALESVFASPMAFKNPIVFSLNITLLASILPTALFIICRRDPIYVAQSTLLARLEYFGRKDKWFSVKPTEYIVLKDLPYDLQIAGQIFYTERQIRQSLAEIAQERFLIINYSDLCRDPQHEVRRISEFVAKAGFVLQASESEHQPIRFENRNQLRITEEEFQRLEKALSEFESGEVADIAS